MVLLHSIQLTILHRKKKSKSKSKDREADAEAERIKELEKILEEQDRKSSSPGPAGSSRGSPAIVSSDRKTAAEKRFEEVQKKRVRITFIMDVGLHADLLMLQLAERVAKLANMTHKDRVNEFNTKLEALSEHHDIPKVCHPAFHILNHRFLSMLLAGWSWITGYSIIYHVVVVSFVLSLLAINTALFSMSCGCAALIENCPGTRGMNPVRGCNVLVP